MRALRNTETYTEPSVVLEVNNSSAMVKVGLCFQRIVKSVIKRVLPGCQRSEKIHQVQHTAIASAVHVGAFSLVHLVHCQYIMVKV